MFRMITPRQEAALLATSFTTIIFLGIASLIALVFVAIWLVVQAVSLALTSTIEALTAVSSLYVSSDPMVRFLILCAVAYALYRAVKPLLRRLKV